MNWIILKPQASEMARVIDSHSFTDDWILDVLLQKSWDPLYSLLVRFAARPRAPFADGRIVKEQGSIIILFLGALGGVRVLFDG